LIFIPVGTFHAYLNTSTKPLEIYEAFNGSKNLSEVNLQNGAKQFSAGTIASATGLSKEVAQRIMQRTPQNYITPF
jgi:oxalate decarboxylase/phosphoglucose isomerase-like protein (cupin superfamily)